MENKSLYHGTRWDLSVVAISLYCGSQEGDISHEHDERYLPFARDDAVMQTGRLIFANHAYHWRFIFLVFLGR